MRAIESAHARLNKMFLWRQESAEDPDIHRAHDQTPGAPNRHFTLYFSWRRA